MKRMRTLCLTGLLWMMTCILYAQNQLITYTVPSDGVELKDDFTVRVRQSGSGWKEVVTYPMKVDEVRQTKHHVELASMGYFDFSGQVEVSVTYKPEFGISDCRFSCYARFPIGAYYICPPNNMDGKMQEL